MCRSDEEADLQLLEKRGWTGPHRLLLPGQLDRLLEDYLNHRSDFIFPRTNWHDMRGDTPASRWFKSFHRSIESFRHLVCHPLILRKIHSILGPELIAWGATVIERGPGEFHDWHVDLEHVRCPGLSVHVGLQNVSPDSTLNVAPGSHAKGAARKPALCGPEGTGGTPLPLEDGTFCIVDGALWHASNNKSPATRRTILLQYTTPGHVPAIPLTWEDPVSWHSELPPCLLIGQDSSPRWMQHS